jgi:hypothetical protein
MEYHPENQPPYHVLLGLLGVEVRAAAQQPVCTGQVIEELRLSIERSFVQGSCPGAAYRNVPAAVEPFERGYMIWIDLGSEGKKIYVLYLSQQPGDFGPPPPYYGVHDDTWAENQPANAGLTPPPGLYEPQRGFGKVWREYAWREKLGWATAPEQAEQATFQRFSTGAVLWIHGTDVVYVFGDLKAVYLQIFPRS